MEMCSVCGKRFGKEKNICERCNCEITDRAEIYDFATYEYNSTIGKRDQTEKISCTIYVTEKRFFGLRVESRYFFIRLLTAGLKKLVFDVFLSDISDITEERKRSLGFEYKIYSFITKDNCENRFHDMPERFIRDIKKILQL